jgi:hypothetical protein
MIGLDSTHGFVVFRLTISTPLFSFRSIYLASRQEVFRNETVDSGNHGVTLTCWIRVVDDMINDPEYYLTPLKQDASTELRMSLR